MNRVSCALKVYGTLFLSKSGALFMLRKRIQLGMIHVAVAMTLVPINSTLNRVMIKELAISAALVAVLASLPYLFSPIQVAIGSFSDRNPLFGYHRSPYIVLGLVFCVLGVVVAPQAAFIMTEDFLAGIGLGILAFGAWGMGFNFATVSYLSLASELSGERGRGRTISVMWFMMITGIILTAVALSQMLEPFSPAAMERAFMVIGLTALALGFLGLVNLEARSKEGMSRSSDNYAWSVLLGTVLANRQVTLFFIYLVILLAALLGQDILLEPFGGEAFGLSVMETTRITSLWGVCVLVALLVAGALETRVGKRVVARIGGWSALFGFVLIAASGLVLHQGVFYSGVVLLGVGTGLSTVSNLSLMLDMTTASKVGLFIGAWGMANAISRLIGSVLGGVVKDMVARLAQNPVAGYMVVFVIEAVFLLLSLIMLRSINVEEFRSQMEDSPSLVERTAMAGEPS
jgi:BCD family chlorophyll transporter-like MFS transporter